MGTLPMWAEGVGQTPEAQTKLSARNCQDQRSTYKKISIFNRLTARNRKVGGCR